MITHNSANQVIAIQNRPQIWDKPVDIKRVAKPYRQSPNPTPKYLRAPLLTLQWRILKHKIYDQFEEVHPQTVFKTGDQIKIGVTVNQSGYLYMISQVRGQDGFILFPDSRFKYQENSVEKDKEYIAPPEHVFMFEEDTGQEVIVIIYSRDKITNFSENIADGEGIVRKGIIEELKANSGQRITRITGKKGLILRAGAGRFATFVQNTNINDNEEIIETFQLNHN
jgi:hypothetical protein